MRIPGTRYLARAGVTLVELLVAMGLLAIVGAMLMNTMDIFHKNKDGAMQKNIADLQVNNFVNNMRKNLSRYQITFSDLAISGSTGPDTTPSTASTTVTKPETFAEADARLKIYWSATYWGDRNGCVGQCDALSDIDKAKCLEDALKSCPGRAGYWIEPLNATGYRGLFRVTIRLFNKELYQDKYQEIRFVAFGN